MVSRRTPDVEDGYIPVPVEAARHVAAEYHKDLVIVVAIDHEHNKIHTTTYGVDAIDKEVAARLGETCARAVGCDLSRSESHEDFRARPAAETAARIDELNWNLALLVAVVGKVERELRARFQVGHTGSRPAEAAIYGRMADQLRDALIAVGAEQKGG